MMRAAGLQLAIEAVAAIDAGGTTTTLYWTECGGRGFATQPTDTPADTHFAPRIVDGGSFKREMSSGDEIGGPVRAGYGEILLENSDGALDALRTYSFWGRELTIRIGRPGDAYPLEWSTVVVAQGADVSVGLRYVRLRCRDRIDDFDVPLCSGVFAGTGGLEGPTEFAGRRIPRAYYEPRGVPLLLVDAAKYIYLAAENPASSVFNVYDGGAAVTMGATYANTATLESTAPAAGQARVYLGGPTYVRFGTAPSYDVSIHAAFLTLAGNNPALSAVLTDELGITTSAGSGIPLVGYWDNDDSYLAAMARACTLSPSWFGFDRLGDFAAGDIADPSGGTATFDFTRHNIVYIDRVAPTWCPVPVWSVMLDADPNYSYGSNLSPSAIALYRRRYYTTHTESDGAIKDKHRNARAVSWPIPVTAATVAALWFDLMSADRDQLQIESVMDHDTIGVDIADCVRVTYPRIGMDSGKKFVVVGVELVLGAAKKMRFTLWG